MTKKFKIVEKVVRCCKCKKLNILQVDINSNLNSQSKISVKCSRCNRIRSHKHINNEEELKNDD